METVPGERPKKSSGPAIFVMTYYDVIERISCMTLCLCIIGFVSVHDMIDLSSSSLGFIASYQIC